MTDRVFAERLRRTIQENPDLTEAGLAVRAGLSNAVIRKFLKGYNRSMRLDTAEKICAALGTTYEAFMADAASPEERAIARLTRRLPAPLRRKLLTYGEGLLDAYESAKGDTSEAAE